MSQYDIVIIGSGPSSCFMAHYLLNFYSKYKICLITSKMVPFHCTYGLFEKQVKNSWLWKDSNYRSVFLKGLECDLHCPNNDNKPNEQANPELPEGLQGFDNILENTSIGKIAKEITEEIDIESMANDGDISQLFNPENMSKIFSSINSKITNNENFSQEALQSEAQGICGNMKDNPLFSQLMGGIMGGMQMPQPARPQTPSNTRNINVDKSHDPNKTKARLQKKLDKKIKIEKLDEK